MIKTMKSCEDEYVNRLLFNLDYHIKVAGGAGLFTSEGERGVVISDYADMGFEELLRHLFPNGIEFRLHNRRVIEDPLKKQIEYGKLRGSIRGE